MGVWEIRSIIDEGEVSKGKGELWVIAQ